MNRNLIEPPGADCRTFLDFPLVTDLDQLNADFAILGIPYGMPYEVAAMANDQSTAPDAIRQSCNQLMAGYTKTHYDWDLDGPLLDNRDIRVVDCGNVTADRYDHAAHYRRAQEKYWLQAPP